MESYYITDVGKKRDNNEDAVIIVKGKKKSYLMAVADGMGGHSSGEVASNMVIDYLVHQFQTKFNGLSEEEAIVFIHDTINEVNKMIFKYTDEHPESKGMGTTLVLALVTKDYILMANIGDSSGYVLKNNKLHKVTIDHTLVNYLVLAGELTEEEARNHPRKNILMKALGANDPIEADIFECDKNIDGIFLCSDGVTNMIDREMMEECLQEDMEIEEKIVNMVNKCNTHGGLDNISIAYLNFKEGEK